MNSRRGYFSEAVRRIVRDRVGGRCSNPLCRHDTVGPSREATEKTVSIGVACHINAASIGGPRYDATQSELARHSIENAIWLCEACAALIDKTDGLDYPAGLLRQWKLLAEQDARLRLEHGPQLGPASRRLHNVAARNPEFLGREQELSKLHDALCSGGRAGPVVAVHALGGTGKSSLAHEYALQYADDYHGVWWTQANNRQSLIQSLASFAVLVEPNLSTGNDAEQTAIAGLAALGGTSRPWLLIFDDVTNPETIRGLTPARGGRVLITTQWTDWGGWATELPIGPLRKNAAVEFLISRSGRSDREGASTLAEKVGCLPLALDHAGAYIKLTGTSFSTYSEQLTSLMHQVPRGALYPSSVAATFRLAIDRATQECAEAALVIDFCSLLAPHFIPSALIRSLSMPPPKCDQALAALASVSLIKHAEAPPSLAGIKIHRLVQTVRRGELESAGRLDKIVRAAVDAFVGVLHGDPEDPRTWPLCDQLIPHILAIREIAYAHGLFSAHFLNIFMPTAIYLGSRGFYGDAEQLLKETLEINTRLNRGAPQNMASILTSLGFIYERLDRLRAAETCHRRAVELGEHEFGRKHPRVGHYLNNLGHLLWTSQQYPEALRVLRRSLRLGKAHLGKHHIEVAMRTNNLANVYRDMNELAKAESSYREAIAIGERVGVPAAHHLVVWYANLANLLSDRQKYDEANTFFEKALDGLVHSFGLLHPNVARVRTNYSQFLLLCGRISEAVEHSSVALAIMQHAFGPAHSWTVAAAQTFADALRARKLQEEPD